MRRERRGPASFGVRSAVREGGTDLGKRFLSSLLSDTEFKSCIVGTDVFSAFLCLRSIRNSEKINQKDSWVRMLRDRACAGTVQAALFCKVL